MYEEFNILSSRYATVPFATIGERYGKFVPFPNPMLRNIESLNNGKNLSFFSRESEILKIVATAKFESNFLKTEIPNVIFVSPGVVRIVELLIMPEAAGKIGVTSIICQAIVLSGRLTLYNILVE